MKMKFKDLHKKFESLEIEVDEDKLNIVIRFLMHCVVRGLLKDKSPQLTMLIREAMEYSRR